MKMTLYANDKLDGITVLLILIYIYFHSTLHVYNVYVDKCLVLSINCFLRPIDLSNKNCLSSKKLLSVVYTNIINTYLYMNECFCSIINNKNNVICYVGIQHV